MEDHYYSQKLKQYFPTRLDYLLYAHDGRGFGHVSRTVAIGLALRRLYPEARVLVISGSMKTGMMIGPGALDWIKLPSYHTVLTNGVSEGRSGNSGYYKSVLGNLRADMLTTMVEILKPYCVLVDHNPFGKRQELLTTLAQTVDLKSQWILGLRGIIGEDLNLWSGKSGELVRNFYREIIWYGDSTVLGAAPLERIRDHFQQNASEMGYVSRLLEIGHLLSKETTAAEKPVCTVSLPWLGEQSSNLLGGLREVVKDIGEDRGKWYFFVPEIHMQEVAELFADLPHCLVEPISDRYVGSVLNSQSAIIYGGYNSVLDVLAAGLPALVILRSTRDGEQQEHLKRLSDSVGRSWQIIDEEHLSNRRLAEAVELLLAEKTRVSPDIDCNGAEKTARHLHRILSECK